MPADGGGLAAANEFPRELCEFGAQLLTDGAKGGYTDK